MAAGPFTELSLPSFTCPCCGITTCNSNDTRHGYCGRCHWWTGHRVLGVFHLEAPCEHRRPKISQLHFSGLCHLGGDELLLPPEVPVTVFYDGGDHQCGDAALTRVPGGIHAEGDVDITFISPVLTAPQLCSLYPSLAITWRLGDKMLLSVCLRAARRYNVLPYMITEVGLSDSGT